MKTYFLLISLVLSAAFGYSQENLETLEIKILPGSQLSISGTTNINTFECDFNTLCFKNEQFKIHFIEKGNIFHFKDSALALENSNFDCGNKKINKDFHKLLKSKEYPEILLKIKKIDMSQEDRALITLNFQIAGIDNDYLFPVKISSNNQLYFDGKLKLNIKDFNLEAPSKIFGLIVLEEEIEINFNLNIQT